MKLLSVAAMIPVLLALGADLDRVKFSTPPFRSGKSGSPSVARSLIQPGCRSSLNAPFDVTLLDRGEFAEKALPASVRLRITARRDLGPVSLTVRAGDGVKISGAMEQRLEPLSRDGFVDVVLPVQVDGTTWSLSVTTKVAPVDGSPEWERTDEIHGLRHGERTLVDLGSLLQLRFKAIEDDFRDGLLSEEEARALSEALREVPGTWDQDPSPLLVPMDENFRSAKIPPETGDFTPAAPGANCIHVEGTAYWRDENEVAHPALGLTVQIWDDDPIFDTLMGVTGTDGSGHYEIDVDDDDGVFQGDPDIYVRFYSSNSVVSIGDPGLFGGPYHSTSSVYDETGCGTLTVNFTSGTGDPGPGFGLCSGASWIALYEESRIFGFFLPHMDFDWPGETGSAFFDGEDINLRPGDRWDWDVLMHEYGHFVQTVSLIENNPGGAHTLGDCVSDTRGDKSEGIRLAWGEGWPTFNGTVAQQTMGLGAQNIPRVGDTSYSDSGESNFSYSLEAKDYLGKGEDNEVAVQRVLWDLFDAASDGLDDISVTDGTLFSIIAGNNIETLSQAWAAYRATLSDIGQLQFGAVAAEHLIAPTLISPGPGGIASSTTAFTWSRNVGCGSLGAGDDFTICFFKSGTSERIFSKHLGNVTSTTLTVEELKGILAKTTFGKVKWGVEGSNPSSPATGPYLGQTRSVKIAVPYDWRMPYLCGCDPVSSVQGFGPLTPVYFSTTRTPGKDDDLNTYQWSAPGVEFDDPESPTPTAWLPPGITEVTAVVTGPSGTMTQRSTVEVLDAVSPPPPAVEEIAGISAFDPIERTLELTLRVAGSVNADIFGVTGRKVRTLFEGDLNVGPSRLQWDGRDDGGIRVAPGIYFVQVTGPGFRDSRRLLLAR